MLRTSCRSSERQYVAFLMMDNFSVFCFLESELEFLNTACRFARENAAARVLNHKIIVNIATKDFCLLHFVG